MIATLPPRKLFWERVDRSSSDGCWEWTGAKFNTGYGKLRRGSREVLAHRVAWEMANNRVIPDGLHVMHICDNPPCVRPDHLMLGTHRENLEDAARKGRMAHGERHYRSSLKEEDVVQIRELRQTGMTYKAIGEGFDIRSETVRDIVKRYTWRHIP